MTDKPGSLSPNQRKALNAILGHGTIAEAATAAGLGERTLYRYLSDPLFKQTLRAQQGNVTAATSSALIGLAGVAVAVLVSILKDPDASPGHKIRAAQVLLQERNKAVDADVIIERIEKLEAHHGKR